MIQLHNGKLLSNKKDEIMDDAIAWMDLRNMCLRKQSETSIDVLHCSTSMKFRNSKLISGDTNQNTSCLQWGRIHWKVTQENLEGV